MHTVVVTDFNWEDIRKCKVGEKLYHIKDIIEGNNSIWLVATEKYEDVSTILLDPADVTEVEIQDDTTNSVRWIYI